jgi:NADP-dependent 3-hydroxy acid dehydrogenase YdfG
VIRLRPSYSNKNKEPDVDIQNKVVVITGASAGIGLATAHLLAQQGAKIVLAARSADKLDAIAAEMKQQSYAVLPVTADVRQKADVDRLVKTSLEQYGQIDILINNAGQSVVGAVETLNLDDFQAVFQLNIMGVLYGMQAVIPAMRAAGGGMILNISSMTSKLLLHNLGGYASTKAMLNLLSNTAREELAPDNIRVITVYPRRTETDFGKNARGNYFGTSRGLRPNGTNIVDSAEYVAEKIFHAIQIEPAEQYMDA